MAKVPLENRFHHTIWLFGNQYGNVEAFPADKD